MGKYGELENEGKLKENSKQIGRFVYLPKSTFTL